MKIRKYGKIKVKIGNGLRRTKKDGCKEERKEKGISEREGFEENKERRVKRKKEVKRNVGIGKDFRRTRKDGLEKDVMSEKNSEEFVENK